MRNLLQNVRLLKHAKMRGANSFGHTSGATTEEHHSSFLVAFRLERPEVSLLFKVCFQIRAERNILVRVPVNHNFAFHVSFAHHCFDESFCFGRCEYHLRFDLLQQMYAIVYRHRWVQRRYHAAQEKGGHERYHAVEVVFGT